jgi:hypothetical protein
MVVMDIFREIQQQPKTPCIRIPYLPDMEFLFECKTGGILRCAAPEKATNDFVLPYFRCAAHSKRINERSVQLTNKQKN